MRNSAVVMRDRAAAAAIAAMAATATIGRRASARRRSPASTLMKGAASSAAMAITDNAMARDAHREKPGRRRPARTAGDRDRSAHRRRASPIPSPATASATRTSSALPVTATSVVLSGAQRHGGETRHHGGRHQMHERRAKTTSAIGNGAQRGAAAGRHHRRASPAKPGGTRGARTRRWCRVGSRGAASSLCRRPAPGKCLRGSGYRRRRALAGAAHRACPARSSRPPAITPMRSAMRSATSRICVVMMTVRPACDVLAQHGLDLARGAGIEPGERLVEDDEPRLVHQRAGERHLLAHALGEAFAALMRMRRRGRASRAARARVLRAMAASMPHSPRDEFEIFERRQLVVDHRLVGNPGHDLLGRDRIGERVDAEHGNRAGIGPQQARPPCARSWSCPPRWARAAYRIRRPAP